MASSTNKEDGKHVELSTGEGQVVELHGAPHALIHALDTSRTNPDNADLLMNLDEEGRGSLYLNPISINRPSTEELGKALEVLLEHDVLPALISQLLVAQKVLKETRLTDQDKLKNAEVQKAMTVINLSGHSLDQVIDSLIFGARQKQIEAMMVHMVDSVDADKKTTRLLEMSSNDQETVVTFELLEPEKVSRVHANVTGKGKSTRVSARKNGTTVIVTIKKELLDQGFGENLNISVYEKDGKKKHKKTDTDTYVLKGNVEGTGASNQADGEYGRTNMARMLSDVVKGKTSVLATGRVERHAETYVRTYKDKKGQERKETRELLTLATPRTVAQPEDIVLVVAAEKLVRIRGEKNPMVTVEFTFSTSPKGEMGDSISFTPTPLRYPLTIVDKDVKRGNAIITFPKAQLAELMKELKGKESLVTVTVTDRDGHQLVSTIQIGSVLKDESEKSV